MKLLAITSKNIKNCHISTIQFSIQLRSWNIRRVLIKGALSGYTNKQESLQWYFLGKVTLLEELDEKEIIGSRKSVDQSNQYSILSVPYSSSSSKTSQFQFLLDIEEPYLKKEDPIASIYFGDKRISKDLLSANVWENLVPIKSLNVNLIYPYILPIRFVQPSYEKLALSTLESSKFALEKYFGEEIAEWGIKNWYKQNINRNSYFIIKFPLEEIPTYEAESEESQPNIHKEEKKKKGCWSIFASGIMLAVGAYVLFLLILNNVSLSF